MATEQEIYNYLRNKPGVTHEHAMGMIANIKAESAFESGVRGDFMIADPTGKLKNYDRIVNKKGSGYVYGKKHPTKAGQEVEENLIADIKPSAGGLFQHQGSRFKNMVNAVGKDWETNWKGQIDFALTEREAKKFLSTDFTSVSDSTKIFMLEFEIPADQSQEKIQSRIDGVANLDLESNYTPGENTSTNTSTSTPTNTPTTKTNNLVYSVNKGGWVSEDEYKVGQIDGSIMKKKPFGYNMLSDEEKVTYDNTQGQDLSALTFDEKIFTAGKLKSFKTLSERPDGDVRGNFFVEDPNVESDIMGRQRRFLDDEEGAGFLAEDLKNNYAEQLGYDPENLSEIQKAHIGLYIQKFKGEIDKVRENDERKYKYSLKDRRIKHKDVSPTLHDYLETNGVKPGKILSKRALKGGNLLNIDSKLEDILEDKNFSESFDSKALKNNYNEILEVQNKVNDIDSEKLHTLTKEELFDKRVEAIKNGNTKLVESIDKFEEYTLNNPQTLIDYQLEGSTKTETVQITEDEENNIQSVNNLPEIEEEEEINNEVLPSLKDTFKTLKELKTSDSFLNSSEEGQQQLIDGWNDSENTEKFEGILDNAGNNEESGLPEMTVQKGLLDSIGGISTIASALVGAKALKAANEPRAEIDMPELSDAFNAELYQQEQLSKRGFSPDQEAAARKQISDSYALGIENAVRGTAGDRAKLLAMSGVLDSQRQAALLDFAAKDDAAMQANKEQFNRTLMFKEKFDINNAQQMRNEKMQEINTQYSTNQQLAASAFKYAMDNVNNAKADKMQNQLTQVMINDASAGYDVKEKYSSGLLGKFASSVLPGLFGNNENNTETEQ